MAERKYRFSKHHKDKDVADIQRETEDNFFSRDKNGNLVMDGNIECDSIKVKGESLYIGGIKVKSPIHSDNDGYWKYNRAKKQFDFTSSAVAEDHASSHESGGSDELSYNDLAGFTPDEITATSDGVAASIDTVNTEVTTNGDSDLDNVTLANGTSGQIKHIYCVVEGNAADTWKITPETMCGGTQITFAGVGEGCTLIYADDEGWVVTANNGGTIS